MEYRHLGKAGIRISALSLGSWVTFHTQVNLDNAVLLMKEAYDHGVNFFDNAERYTKGVTESVMGEALKKLGWRRSSYLVSSKYYQGINEGVNEENTLNRKYLLEAVEGSLKRMQLEYLDLVLCHRPDPETPIEETVWAMHNMIESGKAIYWGTSEWSAMEIVQAIEIADRHHLHKPVLEQPQYNLFQRKRFENEYKRLFRDYQIGATTFSPLASGILSGKYLEGIPNDSRAALGKYDFLTDQINDNATIKKVERLKLISDELGVSLAQLSIAWLLKNPNVSTVITGASRVEQVKENMKAMDVVEKLTPDVMEAIEKAVT
jgi:voltage-dependent potassium channel beta subunit